LAKKINRKEFLKKTTAFGMGAMLLPKVKINTSRKIDSVRLGFIGTGLRGQWLLDLASKREDVTISAICDIDQKMIDRTLKIIKRNNKEEPAIYSNGEEDFLNLLKRDDIDAVIIATPWEWHHPMAVAAMKEGKHVGLEVPAAITVEDCWDLVDTAEKTGTECMILENVCYYRPVMAILNMVREGIFGELLHCQCGYQHDLREVKFNDGKQAYGGGVEFGDKGFSEARWRTQHSVERNGDLYPTHGVGPISTILDINRGNRFLHLTSTATQSRGLHNYIVKHGGEKHSNVDVKFKLGDIVTTVIKCQNGQSVVVSHDTNSPRPYSLNFRVQGTNGIWMGDQYSIYLEGKSPKPHEWEPFDEYLTKYDHPLWKSFENNADGAGHGGIDFFIVRAFIESIKRGVKPPLDVYDAVSMSVISPLSEKSILNGSSPVEFPDFTRGRWKKNKPIFGVSDL
jgi:predicted dehydrogenase